MHRVPVGLAGLAFAAGALAFVAPPQATGSPVAGSSVGARPATTPIKHVVIIYQENHTFDDVLGPVCAVRTTPCNGYTGPVTMADGITAANVVMPDIIPEVAHEPDSQKFALHGEWDKIRGCTEAPYNCVSHVDLANIPNLQALANAYAVSDATYAAGHAASFGAHVTLGAGTFDRYTGYNPVKSRSGATRGPGWGCPSNMDALWGPPRHPSYQPTCIPDPAGQGPYRKSKVPYAPTIMERLEAAGLSWHIYEGDSETKPANTAFSVCTYFYWCYANRFNLAHNSAKADFITAAGGGTLPSLSILIPDSAVSQHNHGSMKVGDNYIGEVVSAVENSPEWSSTAIFITYDDCGCFYDHVVPPSRALGLRNPMVIISPYAKPESTDSTTAVQPYSMLAFVQHNFGLAPLTQHVSKAYDYANSFDFSQQPLGGVPMTEQPVSASELRRLAKLRPLIEKDPT